MAKSSGATFQKPTSMLRIRKTALLSPPSVFSESQAPKEIYKTGYVGDLVASPVMRSQRWLCDGPIWYCEQVYAAPQAGAPDDHPGAFHRTIFIFISPHGDRLHAPGAVRAFRCQLPRVNQYYRPEPSSEQMPPALPAEAASVAALRDPWNADLAELQELSLPESWTGPPQLLKELELVVDAGDEVLLSLG